MEGTLSDLPFLSPTQAHAKVWHTYDTQWRNKQKGNTVPQQQESGGHSERVVLVTLPTPL